MLQLKKKKPITPNQANGMLDHINKYGTRNIQKYLILKLNPGKMEPFNACADDKSKQNNFPNKSEHKPATNKGARFYSYIATVEKPKNLDVTITKYHYQLEVDKRT